MPQNGLGFLSRGDGGALMLPHDEHIMTRTYGAKGRLTKAADAGKPFREVLETDIDDIKHLFGDKYGLFAFEGVVGGANRILRRLPSGGP